MIVRESDQYFIMTTQHEHARFSGEIAANLTERLFLNCNYRSDVVLAIQEHDRGWIRLDDTPTWNDRTAAPFSFLDYPLLPKLVLYKVGMDEVEAMNEYAALLCSLHYSSFVHIQRSERLDCIHFIANEKERQQRIRARLGEIDEHMVVSHFKLLQLCDDISLYVCMNEPGVSKANEHPWYKEGFETIIQEQKINAHWVSGNEIKINPGLFNSEFTATLKSKYVVKDVIRRIGIQAAYKETEWSELTVTFKI
ncbi:DUF3891 family protein [Paenibacillus sp. SC116]|uniref:DUF3891 family protein n=1 Tax=Paenibacillus sp. SC116 TaxID=2968986 RepID=UPI00215A4029|nr:DUF3891 family protein [Paenibacillus sp. SC116]MCR8845922.1 DUF3891 family protein [Paenibacillus sp. SC116]